jgi:type II secretory pathway predicted ATPase ExeA
MYLAHFDLKQRPFRSTPDAGSYYPAQSQEVALSRLLTAINGDEGLALVTGDPGTGKTLLAHRLLERLDGATNQVFLTNSQFADKSSLLQAILYDLSLPFEGQSEQELRLVLTDFLLKEIAAGRRTVLVVDEAHHLPGALLEELRLWGNLETDQSKAVQIVLVAQPSIVDSLRRPQLAALSQRLATRIQLEPLTDEESANYLIHQIRVAGGNAQRLISNEAIEILSGAAKGLPRLLNQAAHQALSIACEAGSPVVDAEAALEALVALGLEAGAAELGEGSFTAIASNSSTTAPEASIKHRPGLIHGTHPPDNTPPAVKSAGGYENMSPSIRSSRRRPA